MLEHGGRLRLAAAQWGIPLADWLDLSTGINPRGWPVPPLPADCWRCLPEDNDGLEATAAAYYGNPNLLPVAGSQAAIQCLPHLLPRAAVVMPAPIYNEHPHAWERAGHKVRRLAGANLARALTAMAPTVLLCNPNNPTGRAYARDELLDAAAQLKKRGGTLVVDEAFADANQHTCAENCVAPYAGTKEAPNLIVLRSLGKFFGLAGARVGFLLGRRELLARMIEELGPWTVSGPSRLVAQRALADVDWHAATRARLATEGERLRVLLAPLGEVRATPLFCWLPLERAQALHDFLAARGILVRLFAEVPGLRIGLPGDEPEWQRLAAALNEWSLQ